MCKPGEPCPGAEEISDRESDELDLAYIKSYDERVTKGFKKYPEVSAMLFNCMQVHMILKQLMLTSLQDRMDEVTELREAVTNNKSATEEESKTGIAQAVQGITKVLELMTAKESAKSVSHDSDEIRAHAIKYALIENKVPDEVIKANMNLILESLVADRDFDYEHGKDKPQVIARANGFYNGATLHAFREQPAAV